MAPHAVPVDDDDDEYEEYEEDDGWQPLPVSSTGGHPIRFKEVGKEPGGWQVRLVEQ